MYYLFIFKVIFTPHMGLELSTPRSRVLCSTNPASLTPLAEDIIGQASLEGWIAVCTVGGSVEVGGGASQAGDLARVW